MREHGWALFLSALVGFLLLPATPVLQVVTPVGHPVLLLIPAFAACAVAGWLMGGRFVFAAIWAAFAIYLVVSGPGSPGESSGYLQLERGWSLLLAGAFGLVSVAGAAGGRFFARALVTVAVALILTGAAFLGVGSPGATARRTIDNEIARRTRIADSTYTQAMQMNKAMFGAGGDSAAREEFERAGRELMVTWPAEQGPRFFPALLALESLCALALAYAMYHRLARARIGLPLAKLRDFRFNDQLVWGVIVGVVFLVVPTLRAWRGVGANLTLFFGTLYAVRGTGVLAWFLRSAKLGVVTLIAVALLAGMLAPALALGLGLIGLGDTWEDWRAKARPTT